MIYESKKRILTEKKYFVAFCDNCNCELQPVLPDKFPESLQFRDALVIHFEGGYGMYFDSFPDHNKTTGILCRKCADKLISQHPYFARVLAGTNWVKKK